MIGLHLSGIELAAVLLLNVAVCISILFAVYGFTLLMKKQQRKRDP